MNDKTVTPLEKDEPSITLSLEEIKAIVARSLEKEKVLRAKEKEQYFVYEDWQLPYAKATVAISDACDDLIETIDAHPIFDTLNPHYRASLDELIQHNDEFREEFYELVDEMEEFSDKKQRELESELDPEDFIENINCDYYAGLDNYIYEDEDEKVALPDSVVEKIENTVNKIEEGLQLLLSAHGLT